MDSTMEDGANINSSGDFQVLLEQQTVSIVKPNNLLITFFDAFCNNRTKMHKFGYISKVFCVKHTKV